MWRLVFAAIADQHYGLRPAAHRHRQCDPDGRTLCRGGFRGHESAVQNLACHAENCGLGLRRDLAQGGQVADGAIRQEGDGVEGKRYADYLAGFRQNIRFWQYAGHVLRRAHERSGAVIQGETVARHGHWLCIPVKGRRKRWSTNSSSKLSSIERFISFVLSRAARNAFSAIGESKISRVPASAVLPER